MAASKISVVRPFSIENPETAGASRGVWHSRCSSAQPRGARQRSHDRRATLEADPRAGSPVQSPGLAGAALREAMARAPATEEGAGWRALGAAPALEGVRPDGEDGKARKPEMCP